MFWRTVRLDPNSGLLEVPRSLVCRVTERAKNALERKKTRQMERNVKKVRDINGNMDLCSAAAVNVLIS
jgi:hypothetical protein